MNNKSIRQVKNLLIAGAGGMLLLSLIIGLGLEFSFFNKFSPLYNPYYFVVIAFVIFMAQTRLTEKKTIWNSVGDFEPSGLTTMQDVPYDEISPTHISYIGKDGERHSVKHSHAFAIPNADGYDNIYLKPRAAVEALNPKKLYDKYLRSLGKEKMDKLIELVKTFNAGLITEGLPEEEALNPHLLTIEATESDDPDTLMQEFTHHVAEIRKGFFGKGALSEKLVWLLLGTLVGMAVITFTFMGAGVDFRGILQH
jgi:hypothetical protein